MPLALRMENYLRPVTGSHRAELAATGIARWCMSAPVLDLAVDAYPRMLTLADIPAAMRPDHRFRLLLSAGRAGVGAAARVADRVFEATCGQRVDTLGLDALDAALDSAWGLWEDAFVDSLVASAPRLAALPTKQRDGHLDQADALVRAAHEHGIEVELPRVTDSGTLSDVESTQRLLQALSFPLREVPYAAVVATAGADVDVDAVLALGEASPLPYLVVQGRRPSDLARTFVFGESDRRRLARLSPGPVFAVRSLVDDGEGGDLILNTVLEDLQALKSTRATWAQRGVAAVCVAASCFLRSEWQVYWSEALRAWPTVVLMDMGLAGMVGEGRLLGDEAAVHGTYMGLGRRDVAALVWHVDGHPHVMLALGDDLTIQLIAGQLHDLLGDRLVMEDADWSQWLDVLSAVASNVLATEPFLRFDASTEEPAAEGTHRRTLPTPPSVEGRDDV